MNTQQETQLSDDLRQIVAGRACAPDFDAAIRRGRQRRRRNLALRGAAVAGTAALAVAGLVIAVHAAPAPAPASAPVSGATSARASAPQAETAAYVVEHAQAALANLSSYIVKDDETAPGDSYTLEIDPRTGNTYLTQGSGASKIAAWGSTYLVGNVLHWRITQANYGNRTWWTQVIQAAGPIQGKLPAGPQGGAGGTPEQIKAWLASGKFTILGHRVISGHQATGLKRPWADGYLEVWVDSQTYQPLRVAKADFANQKGPLSRIIQVYNESWLPCSASLVTLVNHSQIPAGFTQVPAPK